MHQLVKGHTQQASLKAPDRIYWRSMGELPDTQQQLSSQEIGLSQAELHLSVAHFGVNPLIHEIVEPVESGR